jgi:DNA polymerase-4
MQKPDGLVVLHQRELPAKILHLAIRDLPGVAARMELRLSAHGANTLDALWNLSPEQMTRAFGGRVGRHFWQNLHGEPIDERDTHRGSISHSNVLAPELRTEAGAYAMLVRLVHKAGARLRHMGYAAGRMGMHITHVNAPSYKAHIGIEDAQDTQTLIEAMAWLWQRRLPRDATPKKVGIVLCDLAPARSLTLPLFGTDTRRLDLARAMDTVNARHGRQTVYFAEMHATRRAAPMRIAFNSVPDENW